MISCLLVAGGNFEERLKKANLLIREKSENQNWKFEGNPDFFLLDTATSSLLSIGIDEIRSLQKRLNLKPFSEKIKVALITKAEVLTIEAQNALLKTLEEPPAKTLLLLCVPDPAWLLPTVVSRCQLINLPGKPEILLKKEEEKVLRDSFEKILFAGVGERFKILEREEFLQDRQKALDWVKKMIFLVRKLLLENYLNEKKNEAPQADSRGISSSFDKAKSAEALPNRRAKEDKNFTSSSPQLWLILKNLSQTKTYLEANTNVRLTLEVFLLNLPTIKIPSQT